MQLSFSPVTLLASALLLAFLAGCGPDSEQAGDSQAATNAAVEASTAANNESSDNQALVTLYQRSCLACHSMGAAGAPRTGDTQVWEDRIAEKGMDTLVANAINGIGSMPPKGLCNQCTDAEIRDLVVYMSTAASQ